MQYCDEAIDAPAVFVVLVPQVHVVEETAEIPQLPLVKKIGVSCLTCDAKYKVACETCVKDNTVMVAREITVTEKIDHETVVQSVVRKIGIESFIDDLSSVDSKGLNYQDCEVLLKQRTNITDSVHVGKDELNDDAHLRHARDETENAEFITDLNGDSFGKNLVNVPVVTWRTAAAAAQRRSTQQQHSNKPQQQAMQGREEGKKGRETVRKGERGEEEERDAEEEGDTQVKKDVTGWTVVMRNKRQRKMVQIFVKVDEAKVTPMDVSLTDGKVEDVIRQVQKGEDVYVTMQGKVLRRNEKLKSCGVTDGCTIQVTSRMRGGGRHKDKKSKFEKKQTTNPERPEQKRDGEARSGEGSESIPMDEVLRQLEESEEYQKKIEHVSEGSEGEVQQKVQDFLACMRVSWMIKEQYEPLESGVWRAVLSEEETMGRRARGTETGTARAGTKQARQASAFPRRTTVGKDGSGKHRRT